MSTTDTTAALKAIRDLYCDALTTREVLAALCSKHAEWLKSEDLDVTTSVGLALMDDASDALGDYGDWHQQACRERARQPLSSVEREAWPLPGVL